MHRPTRTLTAPLLLATLLAGGPSFAADHPPAVKALVERGVSIKGTFEAPGGLTGYVGEMQGTRTVAFYLTNDGEHVIVGPMLNADGENLTEPHVQSMVEGPKNQKAWNQLEKEDWIADGSDDADTIIYTFTDPNCPYCQRFRENAEPWIDAGRVQFRHIVVGILMKDSPEKAATILGSDDPAAALATNQEQHANGGIEVQESLRSKGQDQMRANNQLMRSLGLSATPSTYYKTDDGAVRMKRGMPQPQEMPAIMGSPRP